MTSTTTKQQDTREKAKEILTKTYPNATNIRLFKSGNYSGVYYFEDGSNQLVFKMPGEWFPLESETYFLSKAQTSGLVPKVHQVDIDEGWIVMEFIEGDSSWKNFGQNEYLNLWRDLGRAAASIHSIETEGVGLYENGHFRHKSLEDFFQHEIDWISSHPVFLDTVKLNEARLATLRMVSGLLEERKALLHGDLTLNNTIRIDKMVKAFIDPGPWRGGHPYLDLGHIHSQALSYPNLTTDILEAFGSGYATDLDWNSLELQFCSLYWDLTVLRFLFENDAKKFETRLKQQKDQIKKRFENIESS